MSEFTVQSDSIDVEQIMAQIRQRIKAQREADFSEEQIRQLANVKLERFLEPERIRSGMAEYYRKRLKEREVALRASPSPPPSFEFDAESIYRSSRGISGRVLYGIRKLLSPLLKFFFNLAPIVEALTIQQQINERQAEVISQMVRTQSEFIEIAALNYEVMNNLVVEMTRLSIEMKNHRMRVESVAGRLDFDERRARAPERGTQRRDPRPAADRLSGETAAASSDGSGGPERRRRRRRRGRRRPVGAANTPAEPADTGEPSGASVSGTAPDIVSAGAEPDGATFSQDAASATAGVASSATAAAAAGSREPAPATTLPREPSTSGSGVAQGERVVPAGTDTTDPPVGDVEPSDR